MVAAFTLTLMVAAVSEVVQLFQPTRDANIDDFLRDTAGAVTVMLFRLASDAAERSRRWPRLALHGAAVALIALVMSQLVAAVLVYQQRDRAFPTIAAFNRLVLGEPPDYYTQRQLHSSALVSAAGRHRRLHRA